MQTNAAIGAFLGRLSAFKKKARAISPNVQRAIFAAAGILFGIGIWYSIRSQPDLVARADIKSWLTLAAFGAPAAVAFTAFEFQLLVRAIGQRISLPAAVAITVLGTAANMLPLPGAMMTRIAALNAMGSTLGKSTALTTIFGFVRIAIAFQFSGAFLIFGRAYTLGSIFIAIGMLAMLVSSLAYRRASDHFRYLGYNIMLRFAGAVIYSWMTLWAFASFGVDVEFVQAAVFGVSTVIASATTIIPAGLGVSELVSAALAPFISINAADAFLATGLIRLTLMITILPLALIFSLRRQSWLPR